MMDEDEARARFGMPVFLHDHQQEECIIGHDPASPEEDGAVLFVRRGSVLGDRIEYGWDTGHLDGPLIRYRAAADQIERRGRERIEEAHYMALRDLEALSRSLARPWENLRPTPQQVAVWAEATGQRLWRRGLWGGEPWCTPQFMTERGREMELERYRSRLWGRFQMWRNGWRVAASNQGGKQ